MKIPMFGYFPIERGFGVRFFWIYFQAKPIANELYSQRNDKWRLRVFGWSFKIGV